MTNTPFQLPKSIHSPKKQIISLLLLLFIDTLSWTCAFFIGLLSLLVYANFDSHALNEWWSLVGINQLKGYAFFALLTTITFYRNNHYTDRRPFWMETGEIFRQVCFVGLLYGVVVAVANVPTSRVLWFTSFLTVGLFITTGRATAKKILASVGYWNKPTLIIGHTQDISHALKALSTETLMGLTPAFYIQPTTSKQHSLCKTDGGIPSVNWPADAVEALCQQATNYHVIFALPQQFEEIYHQWLEALTKRLPRLHIMPPISAVPLASMESQSFFSHDFLLLKTKNNLLNKPIQRLKRITDIILSSILIVLLSPLLVILAISIKIEGGPAFFGQMRRGKNGKDFCCYKFRTMKVNAETALKELLATNVAAAAEYKKFHKLKHDPRITKVGGFLRKTSLDELPQIFNVFKGDMSLVGPRPRLLSEPTDFYYEAVLPGITGLWQVSGRSKLTFAERIAMDTWYVKNWNLWYDIAILSKTIKVVVFREGAH